MRLNKLEWMAMASVLIIIIAILATVIMFWFMITEYQECIREGGVYARTLFWFVCIK